MQRSGSWPGSVRDRVVSEWIAAALNEDPGAVPAWTSCTNSAEQVPRAGSAGTLKAPVPVNSRHGAST
jgi:hypothetical protein